MSPKLLCRSLEAKRDVWPITLVEAQRTCLHVNFMDWLSHEQGRTWRCSCSWLEPHLLFFFDLHSSGWQARAQHSGMMPAAAWAPAQQPRGGVCAAHPHVSWVVRGHSWLHCPQAEGKVASFTIEAVQTHSHNTRCLCLPTWVAARAVF